jgi:sulfatase maturation enzyme AslB (radical SAM superfamily)
MLEADRIVALIAYARRRAATAGAALRLGLTTNGTVAAGAAWEVLTLPDLALAVSCDGLPAIHDRHRRSADGRGSAGRVVETMRRLREAGKTFRVVAVVRPDTLEAVADGIAFLRALGVEAIDLTLDLWARWSAEDTARLEGVVARCARLWREGLPGRAWLIVWPPSRIGFVNP